MMTQLWGRVFLLVVLSISGEVTRALIVWEPGMSSSRLSRSSSAQAAATNDPTMRETINLTQDFAQKSPSATLKELSQIADLYNIEKQDAYGVGAPWLAEFETEVASLLGKEAAVFCPSGVMAQLIALKIHAGSRGPPLTLDSLQHHRSELRRDAIREVKAYPWFLDEGPVSNEPLERPHPFSLASISPSSTFLGRDANTPGAAGAAEIQDEQGGNSAASTSAEVSIPTKQEAFLCHPSSHLVLHEEGAHEQLLGFAAQKVGVMERTVSVEDVREALRAYDDDPSASVPSTFVVELPHRELGGACTPFEEMKKMGELTKERGIAFHCDGARLWEAQPYYGVSFAELCADFDSVYVSYYKGLGGMTGAMLIGSNSFVAEARVWLRRFGGNVYTSLPYAVSCLHAFREQVGTFEERWQKLRRVASLIDGVAAEHALESSSDRTSPVDGASDDATPRIPRVRFEPKSPQCSMVHCYVRGSQDVLERARDEVLRETGVKVFNRLRGVDGQGSNGRQNECYFEWNLGPFNGSFDEKVFGQAWTALLHKIEALDTK